MPLPFVDDPLGFNVTNDDVLSFFCAWLNALLATKRTNSRRPNKAIKKAIPPSPQRLPTNQLKQKNEHKRQGQTLLTCEVPVNVAMSCKLTYWHWLGQHPVAVLLLRIYPKYWPIFYSTLIASPISQSIHVDETVHGFSLNLIGSTQMKIFGRNNPFRARPNDTTTAILRPPNSSTLAEPVDHHAQNTAGASHAQHNIRNNSLRQHFLNRHLRGRESDATLNAIGAKGITPRTLTDAHADTAQQQALDPVVADVNLAHPQGLTLLAQATLTGSLHKLFDESQLGTQGCSRLKTSSENPSVEHKTAAMTRYNTYAKEVRFHYDKPNTRIPRNEAHSMLHTSRAALYGLASINLYKMLSPNFVMSNHRISTQEFTDFSQIGLLLHDSARQGDGVDYWDKESGENVYHYLTGTLNVDSDKAIVVAEAVANKDFKNKNITPTPFHSLSIDENNKCHWNRRADFPGDELQSNLMSVIQFGDCLDIIRARDHFDPSYLSLVQEIGLDQPAAASAIKQLIKEARCLIEKQGMGRFSWDSKVQQQWLATDDIYLQTLQNIENPDNHFALLPALINGGQLLSADQVQKFDVDAIIKSRYASLSPTDRELNSRKDAGMLWARMVDHPTQKADKEPKANKKIIDESHASLEIRKTYRQPGIQTRGGYLNKNGNPDRSVSMIGFGSPVFAPAGFLIDSPPIEMFSSISKTDFDTGRGKKRNLTDAKYSKQELEAQYNELRRHLSEEGGVAEHNEGLLTITKFNGVIYTQDPTFCNTDKQKMKIKGHPNHPASPILQALYLQHEHELQTGTKLPIYEYKGLADVIVTRSFTDDEIVELWKEAASDYMSSRLKSNSIISDTPIDKIKKGCLSKPRIYDYKNESFALDKAFPEPLQQRINATIEQSRKQIIDEHSNRILAEIFNDPNDVTRERNLLIPARAMAIINAPPLDTTQYAAVIQNLEASMEVRGLHYSSTTVLACFIDLIEHIKPKAMYLPEIKKAFLYRLQDQKLDHNSIEEINSQRAKVFNFLKLNNQIDDNEIVSAMVNNSVPYSHTSGPDFNSQLFDFAESLGLLESYLPAARSRYNEMLPAVQRWSNSYDIKMHGTNLIRFLDKAGLMDETALNMIQEKAGMTDLYGAKIIYQALSNLGDKTLDCRKAIVENLGSNDSVDFETLIDFANEISKSGDVLSTNTFAQLIGKLDDLSRRPQTYELASYVTQLVELNGEMNRLFPDSADSFNHLTASTMQSRLNELLIDNNPSHLDLDLIISAYMDHANSQLEVNPDIVQRYLTETQKALPTMNKAEQRRNEKMMIAFEAAYPGSVNSSTAAAKVTVALSGAAA